MRILSFLIILVWSNFLYSQSPHEKTLVLDCSSCHHADTWQVIPRDMNFNHTNTNFKLTGQHTTVKCRNCHSELKFAGTPSQCFSCHKDIHQNSIGDNCVRCHSTESWLVADINKLHQQSRFPLIGPHSSANCQDCHRNYNYLKFEPLNTRCYDCHFADYNSTVSPDHIASGISTNCEDCHSINSFGWTTETYNHSFFPLTGGHNIKNCSACHVNNIYQGLSQECYSCHQKDYEATNDPNHSGANFSKDCKSCHNINSWGDAEFDHSVTGFPLTDSHLNVSCSECHTAGYNDTPSDCNSCHNENYMAAQNPNHHAAAIPTDCQNCHTIINWIPSTFNHGATGFILDGQHSSIQCSACHQGTISGLSQACYSCHSNDYSTATNHVSLGYPNNCEMCHNTTAWQPSTFNHQNTGFPLTGAHLSAGCYDCHKNGFSGTSVLCNSCHNDSYLTAQNPNHQAAAIPFTCQDCHTTSAWIPSTFNHSVTGFILDGQHSLIQCSACHQGTITGLNQACYSCHSNDYSTATNHVSLGYPNNCEMCHNTTAWQPSTFNHQNTGFLLTGAHLNADCYDCHKNGFSGTSVLCNSCHNDSYMAAQNPNHQAAAIPFTCQDCHTTSAWIPSIFDHKTTGFNLEGQHAVIQCSSCHLGTISGLNPECYSCHSNEYSQAPNHAAQGYPHQCEMCHNSTAWIPSTFNHVNTAFPLTGAHITVECMACHSNGFAGTTTICSDCHLSNYNSSINPNHSALQIPITCETCHSTNPDWIPALFPIHNNYYVLQGAHFIIRTDCLTCHKGDYNNTPNTCYGCHSDKYNSTTNPNHQAAGFNTVCETCHNQVSWSPANWNHDAQYFPIYSGSHQDKWNLCSDCHTDPANYSVFSCFKCHSQSETNINHQGVPGYTYNSDACYSCHPRGTGFINKIKNIKNVK